MANNEGWYLPMLLNVLIGGMVVLTLIVMTCIGYVIICLTFGIPVRIPA